jgi:hypothetical protein
MNNMIPQTALVFKLETDVVLENRTGQCDTVLSIYAT